MINVKGFIFDIDVKPPIVYQAITHYGDQEYELVAEKKK